MEEYERTKAEYYEARLSFHDGDPRYNFSYGKEEIFEIPISSNGKIKLPKLFTDFMAVSCRSETLCIHGLGSSFEIMPKRVDEELSVAMKKWIDDLAEQGIHDPLELLPR